MEALQILALTTRECTAVLPAVPEEWVGRLVKKSLYDRRKSNQFSVDTGPDELSDLFSALQFTAEYLPAAE